MQLEALLREKEGLEQRVYELTMETDNLRSDTMIAKRESLQKSSELSNLHAALAAFERDNALSQRKMNDVWQQRLEESERRAQARLEAEIAMWMEKLREQEKVAREAQQRAQSEEVLRRKQSLDLTSERSKMQRTLDAALTQLQNSREDVVDRALVANLVASYISKKRPKETLVLLSRILNFSDEQLVAVGLKVAPTTIVDSFLSILQPKLVPKQVSGENLAEQWVNFLLEESDQAGHTTGQTTKPSVEKVDSVEEVVGQTPKKAK